MPMDCDEALRLLAVFLDGELEAGLQHDRVEHHLEICRSCFSRAEFERRLKVEVARLRQSEVSPEFEQRIRRLIGEFTLAPTGGSRGEPQP
jgi:predicted anti-sigma-YlaC factor YlaD